jgi:RNA polymerase sigma-70 factor (ECF subfamily)
MKPSSQQSQGNESFDTTRWTMVLRAGNQTPEAGVALAQLCQIYWVPLYAFLRKKGHQPVEAEDIVQSFLTRMIEKSALAEADPHRGRFRSFLISSLQNFVSNHRQEQRAVKRGGRAKQFSLDFEKAEEAYHREPCTHLTAERIFDRQWAMDLLKEVLRQLETECANSGKLPLFERLRPALLGDGLEAGYAAIAEEFHLSVDAVKMSVSRLRKRYRVLLRQNIADTVASAEEIDDELRHLFAALSA